MRRIMLLSLLGSLLFVTTTEARLFWQTYGSVISDESGCGCTWNWNQDYFVPRHSSSCRYGLFSPCKTSCTTSPACKWCHPFHTDYCSIYGPCHYHRRDHVYQAYCGCSPLNVCKPCRASRGRGCHRANCESCGPMCGETTAMCPGVCPPEIGYATPLYNVEAPGVEVLGSISVEGDGLLANANLAPLGTQEEPRGLMDSPPAGLPQLLQTLGLPRGEALPQTLPIP